MQFENCTRESGLLVYSPSFAIVVADVDDDSADDIFVGNHGYPPHLYLNRDGQFERDETAVPLDKRDDRHGYTFVDMDNDGDLDFLYAGGGADGIGKGSPNRVFRNLLSQTGELQFEEDEATEAVAYPSWRARQFHPVANAEGDRVDLYLTSLHKRREGSTNLFFENNSDTHGIRLSLSKAASLNQPFESNGMDRFLDFDRDGDPDFIRLGQQRAALYRNDGGLYSHVPSELDSLRRVQSMAVADFNNDGFPDLYFGAVAGRTNSDNVSANSDEIHFVIKSQEGDDFDQISFTASSWSVALDLGERLPEQGRKRTDASDIFIGPDMKSPAKRRFRANAIQASGAPPSFDRPGTYLWVEGGRWHMRWKHGAGAQSGAKGIIAAEGINLAAVTALEIHPARMVRDYIVVNRGNGTWESQELPVLEHNKWTNDLTAADFNNDGYIDVAGVRSNDLGAENGTPFIAINLGGMQFRSIAALDSAEDDIFRADLIAHGFFNNDGLPDVFFTNGAGLLPSRRGPYQLWLNTSTGDNGHVLLELEGTLSNRDAIGAQVELYAGEELIGYRELGAGYGRAQDTHKLHFGVGEREGPFEARIRWPGSDDHERVQVPANQLTHIRQAGR